MHQTRIKDMHGIDEGYARTLLKAEFPTISPYYLSYFSWPQVFGNTAGPFSKPGMLAGAAMTTFQMECWTDGKHALIFSRGRVVIAIECPEMFTIDWYTSQRRFAQ